MLNIDRKSNKITIINGDTGDFTLTVSNYELTDGDYLYFTVKKDINDEEPVISKEYTEFNKDGTCSIKLEVEDTKNLEPGSYLYDVQVNLSDGRVDTILGPCKFIINKGITDR